MPGLTPLTLLSIPVWNYGSPGELGEEQQLGCCRDSKEDAAGTAGRMLQGQQGGWGRMNRGRSVDAAGAAGRLWGRMNRGRSGPPAQL